jgi:FkbM family methyltransferase
MKAAIQDVLGQLSRATPPFRGKTRALRAVDRLLLPRDARRTIDASGLRWSIEGRDLIEFRLRYVGSFAPTIVDTVLRHIPASGGVYWDIGANIGTTSLTVAAARPSLTCVAFEPSPAVLSHLNRNLQLNPQLTNVSVMGVALSDRTGPAPFYVSNESGNSGVGGLGGSHNRVQTPITVWSTRGDDLIASGAAPTPNVIKIDVEGFELEVLRGLEQTLRSAAHVTIIYEHALYRLRERTQDRQAVTRYLTGLGFSFSVDDRPLAPADLDRDCDIVAVRSVKPPNAEST